MKFDRIAKTVLAIALLVAGIPAFAQDERVRAALEAEGIKYSVYESGSFGIVFDVTDTRSQEVTVISATETYRSLELREIWSVALDLPPGDPAPGILSELLSRNSSSKIGSWAIERDGDDWFVLYTVKVPAGLAAEELVDLVYYVAEVCDELENEYTGKDSY